MPPFFAKQVHSALLLAAKQPPRCRFPTLRLNSLANVHTQSKAAENPKAAGGAKPTKPLNPQKAERSRKLARRSEGGDDTTGITNYLIADHLINDQFFSMEANKGRSSVEPRCDMAKHSSDRAEGESDVAKQSSDKAERESDVATDNSDGGGLGYGGGGSGYGGGGWGSDVVTDNSDGGLGYGGGSGYGGGGWESDVGGSDFDGWD